MVEYEKAIINNTEKPIDPIDFKFEWVNLFYNQVGYTLDSIAIPNFSRYTERWHDRHRLHQMLLEQLIQE